MMVSSFKSWNCLKGGSANDGMVLLCYWAGAGAGASAEGRRHFSKSHFIRAGCHHLPGPVRRKVECLRLTSASDYGPGRPSMICVHTYLMSRVRMAPVGLGSSHKVTLLGKVSTAPICAVGTVVRRKTFLSRQQLRCTSCSPDALTEMQQMLKCSR
ncbi:hypothetical protein EDD16DRAFT_1650793 [Pisolithus croceorrhizus]|nr:hypothetical protein EDD16DRAFT_1650793 [Pisolithus croceorrhizus]